MAQTPEGRVKAKVKAFLKGLANCWFYCPVQNGMGVVGIPDFIGCLNGFFFAIETKAPGKVSATTVNQQLQLKGIEDAGGRAFVCDDGVTFDHLKKILTVVGKVATSCPRGEVLLGLHV